MIMKAIESDDSNDGQSSDESADEGECDSQRIITDSDLQMITKEGS
jgi:hypothetical protein